MAGGLVLTAFYYNFTAFEVYIMSLFWASWLEKSGDSFRVEITDPVVMQVDTRSRWIPGMLELKVEFECWRFKDFRMTIFLEKNTWNLYDTSGEFGSPKTNNA